MPQGSSILVDIGFVRGGLAESSMKGLNKDGVGLSGLRCCVATKGRVFGSASQVSEVWNVAVGGGARTASFAVRRRSVIHDHTWFDATAGPSVAAIIGGATAATLVRCVIRCAASTGGQSQLSRIRSAGSDLFDPWFVIERSRESRDGLWQSWSDSTGLRKSRPRRYARHGSSIGKDGRWGTRPRRQCFIRS